MEEVESNISMKKEKEKEEERTFDISEKVKFKGSTEKNRNTQMIPICQSLSELGHCQEYKTGACKKWHTRRKCY